MTIFWASLSVLLSIAASVLVAFGEVMIKIGFELDAEIGMMKFVLFIPCIICLIIGGFIDWKTIIEIFDRTIRMKWGYAKKGEAEI